MWSHIFYKNGNRHKLYYILGRRVIDLVTSYFIHTIWSNFGIGPVKFSSIRLRELSPIFDSNISLIFFLFFVIPNTYSSTQLNLSKKAKTLSPKIWLSRVELRAVRPYTDPWFEPQLPWFRVLILDLIWPFWINIIFKINSPIICSSHLEIWFCWAFWRKGRQKLTRFRFPSFFCDNIKATGA